MKNVMEQTDKLISAIKQSNEYSQYRHLLENIMQNPDLYHRLNEFRQRNFMLQMNTNTDALNESAGLSNEYADVLNQTKVKDFLAAEQKYVRMVRQMFRKIDDSLEMNLDFLEG